MKEPDINGFLAALLRDYRERDWMDIDGGDLHEMLVSHGLYYERPITEEEAKEDWACEYGIEPGEVGIFPHDDIKALLDGDAAP